MTKLKELIPFLLNSFKEFIIKQVKSYVIDSLLASQIKTGNPILFVFILKKFKIECIKNIVDFIKKNLLGLISSKIILFFHLYNFIIFNSFKKATNNNFKIYM